MINKFTGEYRFLSNFYPSSVWFDDKLYPTVEHAYQAAKCLCDVEREVIRSCEKPGRAKELGKLVTMRSDWESVKYDIMRELVIYKFMCSIDTHTKMARKLLATGVEELIEGNYWHDNYWGVCYCEKCKGVGENNLGKILMEVRGVINDYKILYA